MKANLSCFFQTKLNAFIFRELPPSISMSYMLLLGRLYYLVKRREKHLIERNIRDLLHSRDKAYIQRTTKEAFRGIFLHYFEKLFAAFRSFDSVRDYVGRRFSVRGLEVVNKALAQGKGAILVTAHYGAVEFIPWVLGLKRYPISIILECQTKFLMKALEEKIRGTTVELLSSRLDGQVLFRALSALKRNRLVMTECDEVDSWKKKRGRTIRLFDTELYFDITLDFIAKRSGAPVIGVFLERTGRRSYTLIFEDISVERRSRSIARDALNLWENYVNRHPDQWYQWKKWGQMKAAS
jgi:KDO2-lipid IV(A) lauroyltransferase